MMRNFKKILCVLLVVTIVAGTFAGCGKKQDSINKKAISKEIGVDVNAASERYSNYFVEDSGNALSTIVYQDNGLEELIKNAEHWNALPMNTELKELLTTIIPDAEIGYYYFRNLDRSAEDKYDSSVLTKDGDNKFVISIYDSKKMILYYVEVK